jgi:hypothetical protein
MTPLPAVAGDAAPAEGAKRPPTPTPDANGSGGIAGRLLGRAKTEEPAAVASATRPRRTAPPPPPRKKKKRSGRRR